MALKTLIIGASLKEERYSNKAINRLRNYNHPVVAIGLREGDVQDVSIVKGEPVFNDIHTVSLYINPKRQPEYYDYILALQPKRVIFNPGTENVELFDLLQQASIPFEASCTLVLLSTDQYEI